MPQLGLVSLIIQLLLLGCSAVTVDGRHVGFLQSTSRTLSQAWGDSGYTAWSNARVISPTAPKPTAVAQAFTDGGGDAESIAASTFNGIDRLTAPKDRQTYATVPGVQSSEPPRDVTVEPRTRSINDRPEGPKMGSGNDIEFAIVNGGLAYSQTYEGARAVAGSDAMGLSRGTPGRGRTDVTPIAENLYFNFVPGFKPIRKAAYGRKASVAASAGHRVGALAMSGVANGKVVLAQADSAVAMSQSERKRWDETRDWEPSLPDEP